MSFIFRYDLVLVVIVKAFFVLVQLFLRVTSCVRPTIEHVQGFLSGGLGQEWSMILSSIFYRVFFVFNLLCLFYYWFFPFLFWL